jgi:ATP-dependent Clp protease ATP-binding subunit ClpC
MFERFTERARKVIILAREEAIRLGHNFVGTEHLLLGLVREGDGLAVAILKKLSVNLTTLKGEVEKIVSVGSQGTPAGEVPKPRRSSNTPSPKRVPWGTIISERNTSSSGSSVKERALPL